MRMDRSISVEAKHARVEGLIKDLGLTKCADTLIGGQGSSIRGDSSLQYTELFYSAVSYASAQFVYTARDQ
jgi:hypothetical protein